MINTKLVLGVSAFALSLACGQGLEPQAPAAKNLSPRGSFVMTVDPATNTAQIRVSKQAIYGALTFGEDTNPGTNPANTIQAITLSADLPGQNSCGAGLNCFSVELTNFTGANQLGVFMAIDAITPSTGRALVGSDAVPAGVTAALGGRNFGDLAPLAASGAFDVDITIPDNSAYVVTGTFWGDDGVGGGTPSLITFDPGPNNTTYNAPISRGGLSFVNVAGDEQHFHEVASGQFGIPLSTTVTVLLNDRDTRIQVTVNAPNSLFSVSTMDLVTFGGGLGNIAITGFVAGNPVGTVNVAANSAAFVTANLASLGAVDTLVFDGTDGNGQFGMDNINANLIP